MAWNMDNAEAGLRFQLVDRHPWAFHADGLLFIAIQGLLVTPLLFVALMSAAARRGWATDSQRYLAWLGGLVVLGFFVRSEEHTSAPVTNAQLVCRLLLAHKKKT